MTTNQIHHMFPRGLVRAAVLLVLMLATAVHAEERKCSILVPISTNWEQVICPNSPNERTVTKTGTHYVAMPTVCPASGTNSGGGTPPITGGGSVWGWTGTGTGQTGGGGWGGGSVPTLLDTGEDECGGEIPRCQGDNCCTVCTNSVVKLGSGTYEDSQTDIVIKNNGMPVSFERNYTSRWTYIGTRPLLAPLTGLRLQNLFDVSNSSRCGSPIGIVSTVSGGGGGGGGSNSVSASLGIRGKYSCGGVMPFPVALQSTSFQPPHAFGWTSPWFAKISDFEDYLAYFNGEGEIIYFVKGNGTSYSPAPGAEKYAAALGLQVIKTDTGFQVLDKSGIRKNFDHVRTDSWYVLTSLEDTHSKQIKFGYDTYERLISVDDSTNNRLATLSYDANGNLTKLADRDGREVTYTVDTLGRLVEVTGVLGEKSKFEYDQAGGFNRLLKKTDPAGHVTQIEYKPSQLVVTKVIEPGGTARTFAYDFKGYTFYSTDLRGVVTVFKLNKDGKITSITKNGQAVKTISYSTDRSETATDGLGNVTTIKRNERDDPILITDAEGNQTRIEYNSFWKISKITDPLGNVTLFNYNTTQDLTSVIDPEGNRIDLGYDSFGNVTSITRGSSITRYAYDNRGNVTKLTDPLGNETTLGYDTYGFVNRITDAVNTSTNITNDLVGNPTMVEDPLGNKKRYSYDPKGNIASTTDQLGRTYSYSYDYKDRVTSITDPLGSITRYSYDGDGNLLQQTTNSGTAQEQTTSYSYDFLSRLQTVTDPLGNVTSHSYAGPACPTCSTNAPGPATITDPLGNNSRYSYNKNGKPIQIVDPLGNSTQLLRTALGQISRITDANNNSTSLGYDKNGRTIRRINATGGITQLGYDPLGNLSSITDPKGNSTSFSYDLAGQQIKETRPLGQNLTYSYYANGLLKTATDPKGQTTTYSYDKAGRLIETTYADNTKDSFQYDAVGNLIAYTGPGISSSIQYDQLNRKTQETVTYGGFSKTYSYSYDANGNKQTFVSPEGKTYSYTHNKNNQLTDITADNKTITLEHQWIRQTKTTLPNNITTSYGYNANNWLAAIETKQNSSTLSKQQNSFDKTGNITTKTTEQQTISYSYDPLYQLTQAGAETFSYDNNGNRADSTADANNRINATATASYSYDNNGNTIAKTENNQTTTYSYDAGNRLTQVTLPNGSSVSYAYDPFNRRISKIANNITTFYMYADEGLIGEYTETGTAKKTYAWLPDSTWGTNPISQTENGITYYYLNDHLGTPQKLVDESGTTVWAASYDAFGKASITTNTISNNLRFPGQYYDEETGNHYNWNRYYDPSTGRYTQEDPIGLKGKDYNFYRYVQNSPTGWGDPWGLITYIPQSPNDGCPRGVNCLDPGPPESYNDPSVFIPWAGTPGWGGGVRVVPIKRIPAKKGLCDFKKSVPQNAEDVLAYVKSNGGPPKGFKGGRTFQNDGRGGGQMLPKTGPNGDLISYKEYDITPYQKGVNRGGERIVVGSDGKAYYTDDHYRTFRPMN